MEQQVILPPSLYNAGSNGSVIKPDRPRTDVIFAVCENFPDGLEPAGGVAGIRIREDKDISVCRICPIPACTADTGPFLCDYPVCEGTGKSTGMI
jgi:hypothetical protein